MYGLLVAILVLLIIIAVLAFVAVGMLESIDSAIRARTAWPPSDAFFGRHPNFNVVKTPGEE
jgi:hypothetical protein